jgi:putative phage-type endonuclease
MHPAVARLLLRHSGPRPLTDGWHARRRAMITCSDAAAVLGMSPYTSRKQVFMKKTGQSKPFVGNAATEHGQKYEAEAIREYALRYDERIVNEQWTCIPHEEFSRIGGTPDAITMSGILIEVKCPKWRKIKPGEMPSFYLPQVQVLLAVCDLEVAHFVQYVPPNAFRGTPAEMDVTVVKRDREWFKAHVQSLLDFVCELDGFWAEHNLAIGTPMIKWVVDTEIFADRYERRLKRECIIVEEDVPNAVPTEPPKKKRKLKQMVLQPDGTLCEKLDDILDDDEDRASSSSRKDLSDAHFPLRKWEKALLTPSTDTSEHGKIEFDWSLITLPTPPTHFAPLIPTPSSPTSPSVADIEFTHPQPSSPSSASAPAFVPAPASAEPPSAMVVS